MLPEPCTSWLGDSSNIQTQSFSVRQLFDPETSSVNALASCVLVRPSRRFMQALGCH